MQFVNRIWIWVVRDLISEIYDTQVSGNYTYCRQCQNWFRHATQSGSTLAVSDITVPPEKEYIEEALIAVEEIKKLTTVVVLRIEQNNNIIQVWQDTTNKVGQAVRKHLDPSEPLYHGIIRRDRAVQPDLADGWYARSGC